jgi:Transposase IS4
MAKSKRLRNGIGAKVSVYKKFLHPRKEICAKYPNANKGEVLNELIVVGQEEKTVNKRRQMCVVMRHVDFDDGQLLYTVSRYCKVEQEGATEHFFNDTIQDDPEGGGEVAAVVGEEEPVEVPQIFNEDLSNFRAQGFEVDDDNEPAPENIPHEDDNIEDCTYYAWNHVTLDERRKSGVRDVNPSLVNADATLHTNLGYFIHFFPVKFIKTTVIPATNAALSDPLTWEEFLRFLGLILLMATAQGVARKEFWANDAPAMFSGAPFRLHSYMSRRRFELILKHLKFTLEEPPSFKHPFHAVNPLIDAFNDHTQVCFSPGWVNCLDESMSVWTNQWTCPGWMFVPRKPHPMGNEYHSMGIGLWVGNGATFCWTVEWRRLGTTDNSVPTTCLPDSQLQKKDPNVLPMYDRPLAVPNMYRNTYCI